MRRAGRWLRATKESEEEAPDADLVVAFGIVGIASLARVAAAIMHHETFGAEPTLALLCVLLISWLLLEPHVARAWRGRGGARNRNHSSETGPAPPALTPRMRRAR